MLGSRIYSYRPVECLRGSTLVHSQANEKIHLYHTEMPYRTMRIGNTLAARTPVGAGTGAEEDAVVDVCGGVVEEEAAVADG